ncbi:hypothetical protein [Bernardetia sp. MNP-M8]|uniref:hypothetical protein n=1 Tax=Bernardetia sp. MNP-M8 TaxID=3127470 RepID=UPI0030CA95E2
MTKWKMRFLRFRVWLENQWKIRSQKEKYTLGIAGLLGVLLVLAISFVIWDNNREASVWELVPNDAILVLETTEAQRMREKIDSLPFWQPFRNLPYLQAYHSRKTVLDSIGRDSLDIMNYLKGRKIYVSLHQTSRTSADVMFFVPMSLQSRIINSLSKKLKEKVPFTHSERLYNDITVHELKYEYETTDENGEIKARKNSNRKNETQSVIFTYVIYKNFFIGSYTPFLVEDAVRKIANSEATPFFKENKDLLKLTKIEDDDANLYVSASQIPKLFSLFTEEENTALLSSFENWAKSAMLDVSLKEHLLLLNGYILTQEEGSERDYLSILESQKSIDFIDLQQFIPQETALLYRIGLSDPQSYFHDLEDYRREYLPKQIEAKETLIDNYSFSPTRFLDNLGNEIAVAVLEMPENRKNPEKLAFLKIKSEDGQTEKYKQKAVALLTQLAENSRIEVKSEDGTESETKPLTEIYEELPITRIEVADFPKKMFGEGFSGFSQSYFTVLESKYIVVGSSFQAIQKLIDDYKNERVWGKLVRQRQFFEQIGTRSTVSVIVDLPRSWNWLMTNVSPEWQKTFEAYKYDLLKVEFLAWQAEGEEKRFASSIIFQQQKTAELVAQSKKEEAKTVFKSRLESPPYLVRNHLDRSQEVLVQDDKDMLYLVSKEGKILWNYYLNGTMRPQVYQIDAYKNGKLQYLIATPTKVYLIDRLGRSVSGFPISFPENTFITHLSVIDYDNSKNYRIGVATSQGNVYLYDKTGKSLPGWQPRKLGMALSAPLEHVRAGSRDAMIAIEQNGIVNLLKRNSQSYSNFPLNFNSDITNDFHVDYGNTLATTEISMLTEAGELIRFNLEGKIMDRKFFERGEQGAIFTLAADKQREQNFVIARQDSKKLTLYSSEEELLFSKTYDNDGTKLIQYFNFGASIEVIAVTDMHAQKTYLYYTNGTMVGGKTIQSNTTIALFYSEQTSLFTLYRTLDKECQKLVFGR